MRSSQPQSRPLSILFELFKASQLSRTMVRGAMGRDGMRGDDYAIYSVLRMAGPLAPADLAQNLGMPATTISGYLRRITERGHVEVMPNPDDGRSYLIRLTDDGHRAFEAGQVRFRVGLQAFEAELAAPQQEIYAALDEIQAALQTAHGRLVRERARSRRGYSSAASPISTSSSQEAHR